MTHVVLLIRIIEGHAVPFVSAPTESPSGPFVVQNVPSFGDFINPLRAGLSVSSLRRVPRLNMLKRVVLGVYG